MGVPFVWLLRGVDGLMGTAEWLGEGLYIA